MSIKIFISYHDEHPLIRSEILQPIQTGCANATKLFDGMWRDNEGENISLLNNKYCELTAQYWVWKNYDKIGNPDMVGFMHYRRHFMFDDWQGNPSCCWLTNGNVYYVPYITEKYKLHFSDNLILKTMKGCDCLVLKPYDVKNLDSDNCRVRYGKLPEQHIENFDIFIDTAKDLYPAYEQEINQIANGSVQYLCNMFVMKKDLFFQYSKFCFDILQAVDEKIDSSQMSEKGIRFLGYFGEFLLSAFLFKLHKQKGIKIKEMNGAFVLSDANIDFSLWKYLKYFLLYKMSFGKKKILYKKAYKSLRTIKKTNKYLKEW